MVLLLPKIFLTSFLSLLWGKKEKKRKGKEGKGREGKGEGKKEKQRERGREEGRKERREGGRKGKGEKKAFVVYSSRQTLPFTGEESKYQFQGRNEMMQVSWDEPGLPPS